MKKVYKENVVLSIEESQLSEYKKRGFKVLGEKEIKEDNKITQKSKELEKENKTLKANQVKLEKSNKELKDKIKELEKENKTLKVEKSESDKSKEPEKEVEDKK